MLVQLVTLFFQTNNKTIKVYLKNNNKKRLWSINYYKKALCTILVQIHNSTQHEIHPAHKC